MDFKEYKYKIEGNQTGNIIGIIFLVLAGIFFFLGVSAQYTTHQQNYLTAFTGFSVVGAIFLLLNCLQKCLVYLEFLCECNSSANGNTTQKIQQTTKEQPKRDVNCPHCKTELKIIESV